MSHLPGEFVMSAIDFNCEFRSGAIEVEDITSDGMLAAKAVAIETARPKTFPEQNFGQTHFAPQPFGIGYRR